MDDGNAEATMDKVADREAQKEALAAEADERIKRGAHWADWRFIADGLDVGRNKAMRAAGTNKPYGKAYTRYFGDWMADRPWAKNLDKTTRNHLFWVADHLSEIEAWRETLAQNERAKMNHPSTLKRRYDAAHKVAAKDPSAPQKETSREALVRENAELFAKVQKLERQIDSGDGSLFDLKQDSVASIIDTIARTVTIGRLESLKNALVKKYAALKAADKVKQAKAG
jgi:hypothetical protein